MSQESHCTLAGRLARLLRPACALALLLAFLPAAPVGAEGDGPPLTDEDVVRMYVAGRPVDEIVQAIRTRDTDFDLSDEMLEELRLAGLPEKLIRAMIERQAELDKERKAAEEEEQGPPEEPVLIGPELTVRLVPPGAGKKKQETRGAAPPLVYPTTLLHEILGQEHGLGSDPENWEVSDLAVFLACQTADHVPDQWRSKSPLGRDFIRMPRHRLLAFHAGARKSGADSKPESEASGKGKKTKLRLELPETLSAEVEQDVAHDLVLGIAAKVSDRYIVLVSAEEGGVAVGPSGLELWASVWSRRGGWDLGARFHKGESAEDETGASTGGQNGVRNLFRLGSCALPPAQDEKGS